MSSETPETSSASDSSHEGRNGLLSKPIKVALVIVLVVGVVLLAPRFDPRGGDGEPIPADLAASPGTPSLPDPSEHGVEGAETEEEVVAGVLRYAMESAVLEQEQVDLEISSECTPSSDTVYECTVTFDGQPVRSTIEVQDVSSLEVTSGEATVMDTSRISYEVVEQEVVVTDRAVQLAMLDAVAASQTLDTTVSNPRCDEDLPPVQVVPDGEQAEGNCYADAEGWQAWPNWSEVYDLTGGSVGPQVTHR